MGNRSLIFNCNQIQTFLGIKYCVLIIRMLHYRWSYKWPLKVLLKILRRGFSFRKSLFTSLKNIFPTFVFKFNEHGGLNHITFLLLFLFSEVSQSAVFVLYVNLSLKPLFPNASEHIGIQLQKMFSSDEMSDIRLTIDFGSCFRTTGAWLDFLLM